MKTLFTASLFSITVVLPWIPANAAPPDYFYIEIACPDETTPTCSLQKSLPFVALNAGTIQFHNCDRTSANWSCAANLFTADGFGAAAGTLSRANNKGTFAWEQGVGTLEGFHAAGQMKKLADHLYALEGSCSMDPSQYLLTQLPCDPAAVKWIQPHGNLDHGGGNHFFHDGIDFGTLYGGRFFSAGDGMVTTVILNTGKGWPGTNYRIMIEVADHTRLDYHFEIGGNAPEADRRANIFVAVGDEVKAGQHIGNLIFGDDPNAAGGHVHWGIYNGHQTVCPLNYFSPAAAKSFEALYDSGIEKRADNRPNLCE